MARHSLRRLALTGVTATSAVALLAACGGGSTSSTSASSGTSGSSGGGGTVTVWTHNAGNAAELASVNRIVAAYNASQHKYTVKVQAFPQSSYNDAVVAAASAKKLPCILDMDAPNVPDWAWAGYLAPLTGLDSTVANYLPSTEGKYNGKLYSVGFYDVALAMYARPSVLKANGIRIPTIAQPWTGDEFNAALAKLKATGKYAYPLDLGTSSAGEWWPYAYSPLLQSFGGDLINRDGYKSAKGTLDGDKSVAWATWFRGLVTKGYMALKSGTDGNADFLNGKTAILYSGSWAATPLTKKLGKDVAFLPPPNFGNGPKIGGGSWQWGMSSGCKEQAGALDYLKFSFQDKWDADMATSTANIPSSSTVAAADPNFKPGGPFEFFRQEAQKYAVLRPVTPAYPFISTEFTKTAQDILAGADPKGALSKAASDIDNEIQSNDNYSS